MECYHGLEKKHLRCDCPKLVSREKRDSPSKVRYVTKKVLESWESEEEEVQDAEIPLVAVMKKNKPFKMQWHQVEQIQHQKAELETQKEDPGGQHGLDRKHLHYEINMSAESPSNGLLKDAGDDLANEKRSPKSAFFHK
ncbi:UNVERIFIED_CONTAM: hypothetical protein K2H54_030183 [Gekko kuhli]